MPKDISSTHNGLMTKWPHHNGKFAVELVNHWSWLFTVSNCADICGAQDALHLFGRLQEASTVTGSGSSRARLVLCAEEWPDLNSRARPQSKASGSLET